MYYNPDTDETLSLDELKELLNASIPEEEEEISAQENAPETEADTENEEMAVHIALGKKSLLGKRIY